MQTFAGTEAGQLACCRKTVVKQESGKSYEFLIQIRLAHEDATREWWLEFGRHCSHAACLRLRRR